MLNHGGHGGVTEPASGGMVRLPESRPGGQGRAPKLTPICRTHTDGFPKEIFLVPIGRRCRKQGNIPGLAAFLPTCWLRDSSVPSVVYSL